VCGWRDGGLSPLGTVDKPPTPGGRDKRGGESSVQCTSLNTVEVTSLSRSTRLRHRWSASSRVADTASHPPFDRYFQLAILVHRRFEWFSRRPSLHTQTEAFEYHPQSCLDFGRVLRLQRQVIIRNQRFVLLSFECSSTSCFPMPLGRTCPYRFFHCHLFLRPYASNLTILRKPLGQTREDCLGSFVPDEHVSALIGEMTRVARMPGRGGKEAVR
jgi:hypothetical protein